MFFNPLPFLFMALFFIIAIFFFILIQVNVIVLALARMGIPPHYVFSALLGGR